MSPLCQNTLNLLQENYMDYPIFIETGTCDGVTTFSMEPLFDKIYTIEVFEQLHNITKSKYNGDKIEFILGDSSIELPKLLQREITKYGRPPYFKVS